MWDRVRGLWMEQALDTGVSLSGVRVSLCTHSHITHRHTHAHTVSVTLRLYRDRKVKQLRGDRGSQLVSWSRASRVFVCESLFFLRSDGQR